MRVRNLLRLKTAQDRYATLFQSMDQGFCIETRDHQKAYALGARTYLVKPPQVKDIKLFIESMASYWGYPGGMWLILMEPN